MALPDLVPRAVEVAPYLQFFEGKAVLHPHMSFRLKLVSTIHLSQHISLPVFFPHPKTDAGRKLHTLDVKCTLLYYRNRTKPLSGTESIMLHLLMEEKDGRSEQLCLGPPEVQLKHLVIS